MVAKLGVSVTNAIPNSQNLQIMSFSRTPNLVWRQVIIEVLIPRFMATIVDISVF